MVRKARCHIPKQGNFQEFVKGKDTQKTSKPKGKSKQMREPIVITTDETKLSHSIRFEKHRGMRMKRAQ